MSNPPPSPEATTPKEAERDALHQRLLTQVVSHVQRAIYGQEEGVYVNARVEICLLTGRWKDAQITLHMETFDTDLPQETPRD